MKTHMSSDPLFVRGVLEAVVERNSLQRLAFSF